MILVITFFLTTAYANNQKDIEDDLTNIKIELTKIKLIQKYENRDNKIKEIEKSIENLEGRLNNNLINQNNIKKDFQKYNEIIKRQDARISDINSNVNADITLYTSIIGLFILLVSYFSYKVSSKESEETLKVWIDTKADEKFKPKVDEYLEQLQDKGDMLLQNLEDNANEQSKNHHILFQDKMAEFDLKNKKLSKEAQDKIDSKVKDIEKTDKDKSEYSFNDWYSKFIQKYYEPDLEKALEYINKSLEVVNNNILESKALFAKALTLNKLNKQQEEIDTYKGLIDKFKESEEEAILEQVVLALYNKGVILSEQNKQKEAIDTYKELIEKFSESENESILESVADALNNKALELGKQNKQEEAIDTYKELIEKFSESENESILESVADALLNKMEILLITNVNISEDILTAKKLFENHKEKMIQLTMLEILYNSQKLNQDKAIEEWQKIYKEQSLGGWRFKELEEWNESMSDDTVKKIVKKYIDIFKRKVKSSK